MHCHVGDHIHAGMKAMYMVKKNESLPALAGVKEGSGTVRWGATGHRAGCCSAAGAGLLRRALQAAPPSGARETRRLKHAPPA